MPLSASPIIAAFERGEALRQRQAILNPTNDNLSSSTEPQNVSIPSSDSIAESGTSVPEIAGNQRAVQNVLTLAQRAIIVRWMLDESNQCGNIHIASKAVAQFPQFFRAKTNANTRRASRLWKQREKYLLNTDSHGRYTLRGSQSTITRRVRGGRARVEMKAWKGRGRKRAAWVECLHRDGIEEFERLRNLGVKFNYRNLQALGRYVLDKSETNEYHNPMLDPREEKMLHQIISARFTQAFADIYGIVSRTLTGKHKNSPRKMLFIEKQVAHHLGVLAREFRSGELKEDDVENVDETNFVIDMDNGRNFGFSGQEEVKYADAVSGVQE